MKRKCLTNTSNSTSIYKAVHLVENVNGKIGKIKTTTTTKETENYTHVMSSHLF